MKSGIKKTREDLIFDIISYAVISLLIVACFYPMWYVLCASLSDPEIVAKSRGVLFWPRTSTWMPTSGSLPMQRFGRA